jgi:hypothetical protein
VEEPSYVTSLEYLAREPLGDEALEASYYEGAEYVEENYRTGVERVAGKGLGFRV